MLTLLHTDTSIATNAVLQQPKARPAQLIVSAKGRDQMILIGLRDDVAQALEVIRKVDVK